VEAAVIDQPVKWLRQQVVGDLVYLEVELPEEHLVELPPHGVGGLAVQLLCVIEQVERRPNQRRARSQLRRLRGELRLGPSPLLANQG
jgi:hypothetical protein